MFHLAATPHPFFPLANPYTLLLQKLVVSLDRASRPEVKEFQRRCEEAAVDVLLKGAPPPVRGFPPPQPVVGAGVAGLLLHVDAQCAEHFVNFR